MILTLLAVAFLATALAALTGVVWAVDALDTYTGSDAYQICRRRLAVAAVPAAAHLALTWHIWFP